MKAREIGRRIERLGGQMVRQRGSHRLYRATGDGLMAQTVVPQHSGDVPRGTQRSIERDLEPIFGKDWLS
ncbi:type II toxin-antitoxin system HicA family toxin [Subtercola boreus]|uniref:Addiction module toxin, HicA family n=1 Tax=Subtercola boreus TaxID=120213 RepID=A0A3E0W9Y4_9MICO|nr:hypothetical protein B7R24_12010 [Subtercola boreus]RFA19625.1 hypothetical protein B7R23_11990 [Subtercola boreus]RFA25991.1 hypothetical protein B7R25_12110 [Subtercola boreus]